MEGRGRRRTVWDWCCLLAILSGIGYFYLLALMCLIYIVSGGDPRDLALKLYRSLYKPKRGITGERLKIRDRCTIVLKNKEGKVIKVVEV